MTATQSDLEIKIDLVNKIHSLCNEYKPALIDAMRPFVGQKIVKIDGTLTSKARAALDAVFASRPADCSVYYDASLYSLWVNFKSHQNGKRCTIYYDASVCIGLVRDQALSELRTEPCGYRTDFTAEMVLESRKRIEDLEQQIRDEKHVAHYFERI